jgi:hypothetical protein
MHITLVSKNSLAQTMPQLDFICERYGFLKKKTPVNSKIIFEIILFLLFGYGMFIVQKSIGHRG